MKKFLTYALSLMLAVWMLPVSAGLNIAHHCCHCHHSSMLEETDHHCLAALHHETHLHEACECGHGCFVQHLSLQETTIYTDSEPLQDCTIFQLHNKFYSCLMPELHSPHFSGGEWQRMVSYPPDGRRLLSLHAVLLL